MFVRNLFFVFVGALALLSVVASASVAASHSEGEISPGEDSPMDSAQLEELMKLIRELSKNRKAEGDNSSSERESSSSGSLDL